MKRRLTILLVFLLVFWVLPVQTMADTGPKPSVQITFTGARGQTYYGTLLSFYDSTGPASAWDGTEDSRRCDPDEEDYWVWEKFAAYADPDGYYFLQEWWECSENGQLNWTYYPPSPFKILLYFPETDSFYVSGSLERYAFDSYYTVDLEQINNGLLLPQQSYDYSGEITALVLRIMLTVGLELILALFFGLWGKKVFGFIVCVNVITQILLNVALNIIHYNSGFYALVTAYILLELFVFVFEAGLYSACLPKWHKKKLGTGRCVLYALCANGCSFIIGLMLAAAAPGVF